MPKIFQLSKVQGTVTPEKAVASAKKAFDMNFKDMMTDFKAPSAVWVMTNGLDRVVAICDNFSTKNLNGDLRVVAVGVNNTTSVLSIVDKAKIAKLKSDAIEKNLKASGLA